MAGGNGAGKSTLIGTIAGVLDADAGEVKFAGRPMPPGPDQVRRAGVETVWQEHGLCDDLDAVANIFLGRPGRWVVPRIGAAGAGRRAAAPGRARATCAWTCRSGSCPAASGSWSRWPARCSRRRACW